VILYGVRFVMSVALLYIVQAWMLKQQQQRRAQSTQLFCLTRFKTKRIKMALIALGSFLYEFHGKQGISQEH